MLRNRRENKQIHHPWYKITRTFYNTIFVKSNNMS